MILLRFHISYNRIFSYGTWYCYKKYKKYKKAKKKNFNKNNKKGKKGKLLSESTSPSHGGAPLSKKEVLEILKAIREKSKKQLLETKILYRQSRRN